MEFHADRVKTFAAALVLAGTLVLQGCMGDANGEEPLQEEDEEAVAAVPVETMPVERRDIAAVYSGTTALEADRRAQIVSKTTGVVLEVLAEEGDFVREGEVLARLETDRYALEVERAAAELTRLETDFQRKSELFERQLVSAEDFERVRADYEAQKAAHQLARLDLYYTEIRAPFDGLIAERMVRVGNLVSNLEPAFRITSYDPLLAVLHVPERQLAIIRLGLPVTLDVDAWPERRFEGSITRISPVVDPDTGTFRVTAEINDPERSLKPGLFGRVSVLYDTRENVPVVPRNALISEDDATHVFVVDDGGHAVRRPVTLGYERDGMVEVVSGLEAGERVVTAGKGSLNDGALVEVIDTSAAGA